MWRKIAITVSAVLCLLTSTAVGAATADVVAVAAAADESAYPLPPANITVSRATACENDPVQMSGTGFEPNETVLLTYSVAGAPQGLRAPAAELPASVVADASGAFTIGLTMGVGTMMVTAIGATSAVTGSVVITACSTQPTTPAPTTPAPPTGPLPETGAGFDLTSGLVIGLGAVLIGLALALYGGRDLYRTRRTRRLAH